MKAYLLAAGYATRMYPLTRDFPKPLLEVSGLPIIGHIARELRALDEVSEIVVVTNSRFVEHFNIWREHQPTDVPIQILDDGTDGEENRLGAIGDLQLCVQRCPPGDESAVVVAGDNLFAFGLEGVVAESHRRDAPVILVREHAGEPGPSKYNEVTVDDLGRVVRFREKPDDPQTNLSAIALYLLTPSALAGVSTYLDGGGNPDAPGHYIAWLVEQMPVYALPIPGPWFDIGSVETLEAARARFSPGE